MEQIGTILISLIINYLPCSKGWNKPEQLGTKTKQKMRFVPKCFHPVPMVGTAQISTNQHINLIFEPCSAVPPEHTLLEIK